MGLLSPPAALHTTHAILSRVHPRNPTRPGCSPLPQLQATPIDTKGFQSLLSLVDNTANDSFELYYGLFMYNQVGAWFMAGGVHQAGSMPSLRALLPGASQAGPLAAFAPRL